MPDTSNYRDQLEDALLALDNRAMVLEELDGFIAGILVCPEPIAPGEWFAAAFGLDGGSTTPFDSIDHANTVLSLVMEHYDAVATTLEQNPDDYAPVLSPDEITGDPGWELWSEGFEVAMALRPKAWQACFDAGGDTKTAMMGMMVLIDLALDVDRDPAATAETTSEAPELIPEWISALYAYRQAHPAPVESFADRANPFAEFPKVGRTTIRVPAGRAGNTSIVAGLTDAYAETRARGPGGHR